MKVLVDTSVWIEFFGKTIRFGAGALDYLLESGDVVTCYPVKAEVLSGLMSSQTKIVIARAMDALNNVDEDWNSQATWNRIADLANLAHKKGLGVPGIVDRMILVSAQSAGVFIWTFDKKLKKLAAALGLLFDEKTG